LPSISLTYPRPPDGPVLASICSAGSSSIPLALIIDLRAGLSFYPFPIFLSYGLHLILVLSVCIVGLEIVGLSFLSSS